MCNSRTMLLLVGWAALLGVVIWWLSGL